MRLTPLQSGVWNFPEFAFPMYLAEPDELVDFVLVGLLDDELWVVST